MRRLGARLPKWVIISCLHIEPLEPVCLVADDGMSDWMRASNDHFEAQTSGTSEVQMQEIGGHDVNENAGP